MRCWQLKSSPVQLAASPQHQALGATALATTRMRTAMSWLASPAPGSRSRFRHISHRTRSKDLCRPNGRHSVRRFSARSRSRSNRMEQEMMTIEDVAIADGRNDRRHDGSGRLATPGGCPQAAQTEPGLEPVKATVGLRRASRSNGSAGLWRRGSSMSSRLRWARADSMLSTSRGIGAAW
jgi:hypothetical protein